MEEGIGGRSMNIGTHSRTAAQGEKSSSSPSEWKWAEETEAYEPAPSRGAEWADRAERKAWKGSGYRSAYAHLIEMPTEVGAGDITTAYRVKSQILMAMDKGGYTTNEWNRLHGMLSAWEGRALGTDVGFMLRGWKKAGDGKHTPTVEKALREIRKEMGNGRKSK